MKRLNSPKRLITSSYYQHAASTAPLQKSNTIATQPPIPPFVPSLTHSLTHSHKLTTVIRPHLHPTSYTNQPTELRKASISSGQQESNARAAPCYGRAACPGFRRLVDPRTGGFVRDVLCESQGAGGQGLGEEGLIKV